MPASAETQEDIVSRLRHLVGTLDIRTSMDKIGDTTSLFEGGLGLDSFAVLELIVGIEREFGIEFPEADLSPESFQDLRTLGEVVARNIPSSE